MNEEIEEIINMGALKKKKNGIVHYFNIRDEEVFFDEDNYCHYDEFNNTFVVSIPIEPFIKNGEWQDIYSIRIDSEALFWKFPAANIEILIL